MKLSSLLIGLTILTMAPAISWSATAKAFIQGTHSESDITGIVILEDSRRGLKVTAQIANVPAGDHGFHIHEFGDCGGAGKNAGGHYNPHNKQHGNLMKAGFRNAHAGDLGNMTIGNDGRGRLEVTIKGLKISGKKRSVAGRAFILHAKPDDFGQPTGNAGGRIACGAIVLSK